MADNPTGGLNENGGSGMVPSNGVEPKMIKEAKPPTAVCNEPSPDYSSFCMKRKRHSDPCSWETQIPTETES